MPDPVWNTSSGKWSSCVAGDDPRRPRPDRARPARRSITPSSALTTAAAALTRASACMRRALQGGAADREVLDGALGLGPPQGVGGHLDLAHGVVLGAEVVGSSRSDATLDKLVTDRVTNRCMDAFAALADPVRRDLLDRLARGPARVVDLAADHEISRPAISRHLRVLGEAGLVTAEERGRERHYRLERSGLAPVDRAWLSRSRAGAAVRRVGPRRPRPGGPPHRPRTLHDAQMTTADHRPRRQHEHHHHRRGPPAARRPRRDGVRRLRAHLPGADRRRLGRGDRVRRGSSRWIGTWSRRPGERRRSPSG